MSQVDKRWIAEVVFGGARGAEAGRGPVAAIRRWWRERYPRRIGVSKLSRQWLQQHGSDAGKHGGVE